MIFEQNSFPGIKSKIDWYRENHLYYLYKTINKQIIRIIPLAALHPQGIVVKGATLINSIICTIVLVCIIVILVGLGQDYYAEPANWASLNDFIAAESVLGLLALISACYFWRSNRKQLIFYFNDMKTIAFSLHYTSDPKIKEFKAFISSQILQSAVHKDKENILLLEKGIYALNQQKIISKEFENTLSERLMSMSNIDDE